MPVIQTLGWVGNAYPTLAGPWTGAMQTADGQHVVVWKNGSVGVINGQLQVFSRKLGSWSGIAQYPANATPVAFSHVYKNTIVFIDSVLNTLFAVPFSTAGVASNVWRRLGNYDIRFVELSTNPSPSHTFYQMMSYRLVYFSKRPDLVYIIYQTIFGTSILVAYSVLTLQPVYVITCTDNQLAILGAANASVLGTTASIGTDLAYFPDALFTQPLSGAVPTHSCPGGTIIVPLEINVFTILSFSSGPAMKVPILPFGGTITNARLLDRFQQTVMGIVIAENGILDSTSYTTILANAGHIQAVSYQPYMSGSGGFVPGTAELVPASFTSANWWVFSIGNLPYILDDAGHFLNMSLLQYDFYMLACSNWRMANKGTW